ncbi:MAG: type II toxin-antitoxin system VapC family toxin [Oscillospiraceae bacterium]|nr:type II toxin-antitoxin system VapC family toxin [Oscillospiraceae bacterium]
MNLLIDTHTALWLFNEHENLSYTAKKYLLDENNKLYISMASAWEVAIKRSVGKFIEFSGGVKLFLSAINKNPINIVMILPEHIEIVERLPYIHRDPFDRLIIATAICENMTIITKDEHIKKYDVSCVW